MRILIIHPEGNYKNNPSLKALVDTLCDYGFNLTIKSHRIYQVEPYRCVTHHQKSVPLGFLSKIVHETLSSPKILCSALATIDGPAHPEGYDLIFGVDREGVIDAATQSRRHSCPYIFISFEIMFANETSTRYKQREIEAAQGAILWITQDDIRAKKLMEENQLDPRRCMILPLACRGRAMPPKIRVRDRLGIHPEKKVALFMGSITDWTMFTQVLETVPNWPHDWVLIVNERYGKTSKIFNKYPNLHEMIKQNRIYINNYSFECVDQMQELFSGVNVGFAFYSPTYSGKYTGNNLKYIGMSSGKISTFWRSGVPVLMNNIGHYARIAVEHRCSIVMNKQDLSEIPQHLDRKDFSEMGRLAFEYYRKHLDFDNYKPYILDAIMTTLCQDNKQ